MRSCRNWITKSSFILLDTIYQAEKKNSLQQLRSRQEISETHYNHESGSKRAALGAGSCKLLELGIQRLRAQGHQSLLTPRQRHRVRLFDQTPLKERSPHLRHREIPVGRILFEERLVAEEAADPAA